MNTEILEEIEMAWGWKGICPVEIISENDFGNVIFKDKANSYWRICPEELSCERIASDRSELDTLLNDDNFQLDWQLGEFATEVREAFGPLTGDEKYSLRMPASLGGSYSIDNVAVVPIKELISFSGDIAHQLNDVPDGSQVRLRFVD